MALRLLAAASRLADAPEAAVVVLDLDRSPHPEMSGAAEPRPTLHAGARPDAGRRPEPRHEEGGGIRPSPFHTRPAGPGRYLRIRGLDDASAPRTVDGFDGMLLSDTSGPIDVERLGARLAVAEAEAGVADGTLRIIPVVGTPRGVLSLPSFGPLPRLAGIACDPDRLAAALGCAPDAPAIVQARASTVLAAGACRVPAILVRRAPDETAAREGFTAILLDDRPGEPPASSNARRPADGCD